MLGRTVFVGLFVVSTSAAVPAADPLIAPAPRAKRDHIAELIEKLNTPIENPIQPNGTSAKKYLAKLAQTHDVEIVLDEEAFKQAGAVAQPGESKLSFLAPKGIRLHTLLGLVGTQIHRADEFEFGRGSKDRRSLLIRDNCLVVTTYFEVQDRQGASLVELPADEPYWTLLTTVWVDAVGQPLSTVLRRLADSYEVNIVVTAEAAKSAEARITSRLVNAPLGTAVDALAWQCGLAAFAKHNVIVVTTPELAKKAKQEAALAVERRYAGDDVGGRGQQLVAHAVEEKVAVNAHDTPLRQILTELRGAGFNITLDPAAGKKADAAVAAKLSGVACEAAVKQLAELAGLRAVRFDNSLFVTTPEKADQLTPPARKPGKPKKRRAP